MRTINLDKVACPHCGTSGAENLNADSQIEHTGKVDGEGWVSCPDCGNYVEFTEDGTILDAKHDEMEWRANIDSALDEK